MNVSSACAQCGTIANPNDKFCNTCGTPVNRAPAGGPVGGQPGQPGQYGAPPPAPPQYGQPQYGAPPPAQQGFGAPPPGFGPPPGGPAARPPRCQMGHEIAPGASYCAQGHPIALDAMQFASDQYGQPPQGFGAPPPQQGFAPPPPPPGFGEPPPPPAFGAPPNYGAPQQQGGFGPPPQQQGGFGPPPPQQQGGFGPPPPQGFGGPPPGFPPPQQQFQPAPVPPPQYAPPPPPPGFGAPPPQQAMGAPPEVPQAVAPPLAPGARVLRGFLLSYQSNAAGEFWPLQSGRVVVGRANAGEPPDVPLADATISSRHAVFNVDAATGAIQLEDTNSTNGTYVNEEHIGMNGKREVRDGDRIRFGGYTTIIKVIGRV